MKKYETVSIEARTLSGSRNAPLYNETLWMTNCFHEQAISFGEFDKYREKKDKPVNLGKHR